MPPLEIDSIIPSRWVGKQDEQRGKKEGAGGLWPCRTPGNTRTPEHQRKEHRLLSEATLGLQRPREAELAGAQG